MPKRNRGQEKSVQAEQKEKNTQVRQHFSNDEQGNALLATATTEIDLKLYKVSTKALDTALLVFIALILVFIGVWIIQYFVLKNKDFLFMILSIILAVLLVLIYIYKLTMKKPFLQGNINQYAFYKNYILLSVSVNGKALGQSKIPYASITRRKYISIFQDAGYLVLYYKSKFMPIYVHLQDTPIEQIVKLQEIFKIKLLK